MRLTRLVPALLALALHLPRATSAQVPDTSLWVANGDIWAATRIGNTLYVGGSFSRIAPATGCAVPFDAGTAQPQQPFVRVPGNVNVVVSDGAGGWYLGGFFRGVAGTPRRNLVHILAGGTLAPWAPDPDSEVFALALSGSTLYVGGKFEHLGGAARFKIGAVDVSTGLATAFDPSPPMLSSNSWPMIRSLAVVSGAVYAGGIFLNIGGLSRAWMAKLDPVSGAADAGWNATPNGQVLAIAPAGGTLYVGGYFGGMGGQTRAHLAELNAVTGLATAWDPSASSSVQAIALTGSRVYVGGDFTLIAGIGRAGLASFDRATGALTTFDAALARAAGFGMVVTGIAVDAGTGAVFAAGTFDHAAGVEHPGVVQLDPTTGAAFAWDPQLNGTASAVLSADGTVFVGGRYGSVGGVARSNLAAFDLDTGQPTPWAPLASDRVTDLVTDGTSIYASGYFTQVNGAPHPYLARLDAASGSVSSWNPGATDVTTCLALAGPRLYVGSYGFGTTLYAVDLASGVRESWNPTTTGGPVNQIAPDVPAGAVTVASQGGFWRFRASDGALLWSANMVGAPFTVMQMGNTVYVGGSITSVNSTPRSGAAALDATTGSLLAWDPSATANGTVYDLANDGYHVYAVGQFASIGGQSRSGYAVLDPLSALATSDDAHLDGYAYRVFPLGADVFVDGLFSSAGNRMTQGFAWLPAAPPLDSGPSPRVSALQLAAAPVPARERTELRFALPRAAHVWLSVLDAAGRVVATPIDGEWRAAGAGSVTLPTQGLAPGVYLVLLRTADATLTRRIVAVR